MLSPDDIQQIKGLIQSAMAANFTAGVPRLAPHTHDGIDNLKINASNIVNLPKTAPGGNSDDVQFNDGGVFNGIDNISIDKTNSVLGVPNIKNFIDVTHFNESAFSDLDLTSDFTGNLNLATADSDASGSTGNINITTGSDTTSGNVAITTGSGTTPGNFTVTTGQGASSGQGGNATFTLGNGGGTASVGGDLTATMGNGTTSARGGQIVLTSGNGGTTGAGGNFSASAGNGGATSGVGGNITLTSGISSGSSAAGNIAIQGGTPGGTGNSGHIDLTTQTANSGASANIGNINLTTGGFSPPNEYGGNINILAGSNSGSSNIILRLLTAGGSTAHFSFDTGTDAGPGGGNGVIAIQNAGTNPSTNPTGGGILYVTAGALTYRGSSGTVTTIAVA